MIDHHAVLLIGGSLSETGYLTSGSPLDTELMLSRFDVLAISEVRKIIMLASTKPLHHKTKTIVIEAGIIAPEAQQALLKVLEEPPSTTKFILVVASKAGLLPTLLSRIAEVGTGAVSQHKNNPAFNSFLQSPYAHRLEVIAKITKNKDQATIELLCLGVLSLLDQPLPVPHADVLLLLVQQMNLRGSSKKMLLEEIALTLPVVA